MIKEIIKDDNPVLRKVANTVDFEKDNVQEIIRDLFDTLDSCNSGVGLAAPQIGISLRVFVVNFNKTREVFINPIIKELSDELHDYFEGCLSIPGKKVKVWRPWYCYVEYYDKNLVLQKHLFQDFIARIIQHEYDHLNGKLITDYMSKEI